MATPIAIAANGIPTPMPILAPFDKPPPLLSLGEFVAVALATVDVRVDKDVLDALVVSGRSDFSQISGIPSA